MKTDYFTTGQIAKRLQVAPRTVGKWIDRGQLVGFRLPGPKGAGDRRVTREEYKRFCETYRIPDVEPEAAA